MMEQRMDSGYGPASPQYEPQALYGINSAKMDGQKIQQPAVKEKSAYIPRLVLAIISLVAMMIVSLTVINLAYTRMLQLYYPGYDGQQPPVFITTEADIFFFVLLSVVTVLFFVATLVINIVFSRKQ